MLDRGCLIFNHTRLYILKCVSEGRGRSILSKVQKMFVPGCFPIHMDPLTSPSEKNLKKIDTSYWSKQAEVLLYDVVYSDFSPIT